MSKGNPGNPRISSKQKQLEVMSRQLLDEQLKCRNLSEELIAAIEAKESYSIKVQQLDQQLAVDTVEIARLKKELDSKIDIMSALTTINLNLSEAVKSITERSSQ